MFYLIYNQINKTHPQRTNTLVSLWDGSSPGHRAERILIHHSKRLSEHTHTHTQLLQRAKWWSPGGLQKSIKDKDLVNCVCVLLSFSLL